MARRKSLSTRQTDDDSDSMPNEPLPYSLKSVKSPFMRYFLEVRDKLKEDDPTAGMKDLEKRARVSWSKLDASAQKRFRDASAAQRAEWKARNGWTPKANSSRTPARSTKAKPVKEKPVKEKKKEEPRKVTATEEEIHEEEPVSEVPPFFISSQELNPDICMVTEAQRDYWRAEVRESWARQMVGNHVAESQNLSDAWQRIRREEAALQLRAEHLRTVYDEDVRIYLNACAVLKHEPNVLPQLGELFPVEPSQGGQ